MDKLLEVKRVLDLLLDKYANECNSNFYSLPIYKRERIVKARDNCACQLCQIFLPQYDPNKKNDSLEQPFRTVPSCASSGTVPPETSEPKPNESRLLTGEEMAGEIWDLGFGLEGFEGRAPTQLERFERIAQAQLAKDQVHEQTMVEKILKELEDVQTHKKRDRVD